MHTNFCLWTTDCDVVVHRPAGLHILLRAGSLAVCEAAQAPTELPTPR